ncbi:hypothetical protein Dimus_008391 [Dionaea muscipula]
MGCNVRYKHIRANRRSRSMKSDPDHHPNNNPTSLSNSVFDSSIRLFDYMGYRLPWQYPLPIIPSLVPLPHNHHHPDFDDCGWGYCTEEQLEEILLKNLEFVYNEVISKLVGLGYDDDVALKAVLRNGHCYGGMDVLSNVLHNSLAYLNGGIRGQNGANSEESELVFTDLRQLEEYSLAGMVCLLQQSRPSLSKGDAMWCLLMSDLHVGRATAIEIPMLPPPTNGCSNAMGNSDGAGNISSGSSSTSNYGGPLGLCKFHGGWGFGNGGNPELSDNGINGFFQYAEATLKKEVDCSQRFNLNPELKTLLKKNVAAFAAGFRANSKLPMQTQGCARSTSVVDVPKSVALPTDLPVGHSEDPQDLKSQDSVNAVLNKFRDLNLNEGLESAAEDEKDEILFTLMHQVKDLERQVKERKEWAQQKAMQAARKLSSDLTELKVLRMEREETQRLKRGKQTLEDTTMKRLSEMENALRKASSQVDHANGAVRQLEVENAEIRAEMEASKLSASESVTTCLEVAKREKKCLKRLLAWEKQKTKLQEEISTEKQKITHLQQHLVMINSTQKEAEDKWKQEVKAKELAGAQIEEERRAKEAAEISNKRKLETLRLKIEIDFQRHKDDLQRLEQELSRLKSTIPSAVQSDHPSDGFPCGNAEVMRPHGETVTRLLRQLQLDNSPDKEVSSSSDRECIVCMKEEVSVVFLPCAHQVMCASCGEDYGKKGKATCPCCRVPIEQKIRVFGASS